MKIEHGLFSHAFRDDADYYNYPQYKTQVRVTNCT